MKRATADNSDRIVLKDIVFRRDRRTILKDVSWTIRPGEHWAIVGANGSGKTTLLQVAVGYLWPSSGQVVVLGEEFGNVDLRQLRRRIGWVSSSLNPMIRPNQTAREVVLSGAFASTALFDKPTARQSKLADRLIAQMGCGHIAHSPWSVLSLGEQQRVLVARALMARPKLLILDEALAGLDINAREHLLDRLEHLARGGGHGSMVLVTHHIEEIPPGFTHVLLMKSGRVLAQGPKEAVLTDPLLSKAFGLSIEIHRQYGRFWPRIRRL